MRRIQAVAGGLFLVLFLVTGFYMKQVFPEAYAGDEGQRMMFRASHIYLLLGSLINLMAVCISPSSDPGLQKFQHMGALLQVTALPLLLVAFVTEPAAYDIDRSWTMAAMIALLLGSVLQGIAALPQWLRRKG
ncbi:hypothetical protein LJ739_08190 [Aestuariibacter halophilus]|uniref:Transmembrane protein n=1 Tax=Fluctibacter halophilus TaxID=226011 RepID=A0ABS8GAG2_9ALTE|nr:hypothetical protein [Aestuariibacter halophilus]MCC2616216.1 hypothetical protein [Aestuariibacter halophilus]